MTITPEQIEAAKVAYEAAVSAQAIAKQAIADLKADSASVVKAYNELKQAFDALKPSMAVAKALLQKADADVTITRAGYQAVAPKESTATNGRGTGNKALLAAVQAFLFDKPDGASNGDIYDALVASGVEMAGANSRANFNAYLSRWGSAGQLVSQGTGKWGVASAPVAAPPVPSFLAPPVVEAPVVVPVPVGPDELGHEFPGYEPLIAAGFLNRSSLKDKTAAELVNIPGIGAKTADKILAALAS